MNRYRRSAKKSTNESIQNSCNGILFTYASDSMSRKPNIISRKSSLKKAAQGSNQDHNFVNQQQPVKEAQSPEVTMRVAVPSVDQSDESYDSSVYYMLDDGSVVVENTAVAEPTVVEEGDYQVNTTSPSEVIMQQTYVERQVGLDDTQGNNEPEQGTVLEQQRTFPQSKDRVEECSEPVNTESVGVLPSPVKLAPAEEDDNMKYLGGEELRGDTGNILGGQSEENQDENQYVILQMGSQTLLVPVGTFQQYCDAQQSGDMQSVANFYSQIEQALVDSNGEAATDVGNVKMSLANATPVNGSCVQQADPMKSQSENAYGVTLNKEEKVELPVSALANGNNATMELSASSPSDKKAGEPVPAELQQSCGITEKNVLDEGGNDEPPTKKVREDKVVPAKDVVSPSRQLAGKPETDSTKKENINIFRCGTCTMLFATKDLCMQHIYDIHKADPLKTQCDLRRTNETRFICHGCSRTFGSLAEFHKHNLLSHSSASAGVKDKVTSTSSTKLVPVKSSDQLICKSDIMDNKEKKSDINNCSLPVSKKSSLNYPNSFDCSKCSKTFVSLYYYLLHGLLHWETTGRWVCQICSENFSAKPNLVEHFRVHCEGKHGDTDINTEGLVARIENGEGVTEDVETSPTKILSSNKEPKNPQPGELEDCGEAEEKYKADPVLRRRGRRKNLHTDSRFCNSSGLNPTPCLQSLEHEGSSHDIRNHMETSIVHDIPVNESAVDASFVTAATPDNSPLGSTDSSIQFSHSNLAKEGTGEVHPEVPSQDGSAESDPKLSSVAENRVISPKSAANEGICGTEESCSEDKVSSGIPQDSGQSKQGRRGSEKSKSRSQKGPEPALELEDGALSRALRSRRQSTKQTDTGTGTSLSPAHVSARNTLNRKSSTRRVSKTVSLEIQKQTRSKVRPVAATPESSGRLTRRSTIQNISTVDKTAAKKGKVADKKDVVITKPGRKSSGGTITQVNNTISERKSEEFGRKSGAEKRSNVKTNTKGLRSAKKEETVRLRSRVVVAAEEKGKRVRKNATTSRELLPEDGPKFESSSTKAKPAPTSRKKRGMFQPEQIANSENRCRVQQSFIAIFKQVKKTDDSLKDRRNK